VVEGGLAVVGVKGEGVFGGGD
jgi:hypothetical protein